MTPFWIGFIWFVVGMFVGCVVIFGVSLYIAIRDEDKIFIDRDE